jgi:hypothetical protein
MGMLVRLWALLRGQKILFLRLQRRGEGYFLITSPHMRGFSLMLHPEDTRSAAALSKAIEGPLTAFVEAECKAYDHHQKRHMSGFWFFRSSEENIVAGYCNA